MKALFRSLLISNLSFAVKAVFTFGTTTLLANTLSVQDFALWSLLISLSLFFTLSDMGIGQLLLRSFVDFKSKKINEIAIDKIVCSSNKLLAFICLLFFVVGYIALPKVERIGSVDRNALIFFMVLILGRTFFIPYQAQLSAYEKFHVRKNIEALVSILGFIAVSLGIFFNMQVVNLILLYVSIYLAGGFLYYLSARFFNLRNLLVFNLEGMERYVISSSLPYFVNNLSLLITRGGLILLVSFLIGDRELAEIAIYYAVFYQVAFQFFDILIRVFQPRIRFAYSQYLMLEKMMLVALIFYVLVSILLGGYLFGLAYPEIEFSNINLTLFVFLAGSEILFSIFNSRWQMDEGKNKQVLFSSLIKAFLYMLVVGLVYALKLDIGLSYILFAFLIANVASITLVKCAETN